MSTTAVDWDGPDLTPAVLADDPFATPEDVKLTRKVVEGGRYRLPYRDGSHKPRGWMRATNLVSAFSDQKRLQDWQIRTILAGLAVTPSLVTELQELIVKAGTLEPDAIKALQDQILELAERAKDAAGGGRGRDRGNRIHEITEYEWRGEPAPFGYTDDERRIIRLFAKALADAQLSPIPGYQERIVLVESVEACGKFDTLLRDLVSDLYHMGDTKTQKRFWTWLEVEAQLALYAHADAWWDAETGSWIDPPIGVDRCRGAALWFPEGAERVQVKTLDLERGWDTVQLAYRNVCRRSECKSARQEISGGAWRPVTDVERYAALLRQIESREEGSRVYREASAAGVWCPELEQVAAKVLSRLP